MYTMDIKDTAILMHQFDVVQKSVDWVNQNLAQKIHTSNSMSSVFEMTIRQLVRLSNNILFFD